MPVEIRPWREFRRASRLFEEIWRAERARHGRNSARTVHSESLLDRGGAWLDSRGGMSAAVARQLRVAGKASYLRAQHRLDGTVKRYEIRIVGLREIRSWRSLKFEALGGHHCSLSGSLGRYLIFQVQAMPSCRDVFHFDSGQHWQCDISVGTIRKWVLIKHRNGRIARFRRQGNH